LLLRLGVAGALPAVTAGQANSTETNATVMAGRCEFPVEPPFPGFFWDPSCKMGMLGCDADGKNMECRFCGAGDYAGVPCPPSSCHFENEPFVPYYWDEDCALGKLGCWADGVHPQCRFCGDAPYTSIDCPASVGGQRANPPAGANQSAKQCAFVNEPTVPFFWDEGCHAGKLGCLADGLHEQCRFCAQRPFETIPCPSSVAPPGDRCSFPGGEPETPYFWDESCQLGDIGCWADGLHVQCRFCGSGVYGNVTCPSERSTGARPADALASGAARDALVGKVARAAGASAGSDIEMSGAQGRSAGILVAAFAWISMRAV